MLVSFREKGTFSNQPDFLGSFESGVFCSSGDVDSGLALFALENRFLKGFRVAREETVDFPIAERFMRGPAGDSARGCKCWPQSLGRHRYNNLINLSTGCGLDVSDRLRVSWIAESLTDRFFSRK